MERLWKADREEYWEIEELLKGNSKFCEYMEENHEREKGFEWKRLADKQWNVEAGLHHSEDPFI